MDDAPIGGIRLHRQSDHAAVSSWFDTAFVDGNVRRRVNELLDGLLWDVRTGRLVRSGATTKQPHLLAIETLD
jgi:hypothetical protein